MIKLKRIIALFLSVIITIMMVSITSFASSSNNIYNSEIPEVKENEFIKDVILKIQPSQGIDYGDSIIINIENGKIDDNIILQNDIKGEGFDGKDIVCFSKGDIIEEYQYKLKEHTYEYYADYYERCMEDPSFEWNAEGFQTIIGNDMIDARNACLPFRIKVNSRRELEVELFPITDSLAGETYHGTNKPAYYIPLPITAEGYGSADVTIDSNSTSIRGGQTFKIAYVLDENGNIVDNGVMNKASENTINKVVTIKNNQRTERTILKILPKFGVNYGDSIIINIENGKIDDDIILQNDIKGKTFDGSDIIYFKKGDIIEEYQYKLRGHTYGYYADYYEKCMEDPSFEWNTSGFETIVGNDMIDAQDARLPFRIKANNSKQLQVELFPIIDSLAGETYHGTNRPAYYIPLPITADGNGSVRIAIDSNNTSIRNSQAFKIANVLDGNGNIIDDGKDDNTVINKSSENIINKVVTIKNNQRTEGTILKILPKFGINHGDSIIINIENGKLDDDIILQNDIKGEAFDGKEIVSFRKGDIIEKYQYKLRGHTYGYYANYYEKSMEDPSFEWNPRCFQTIIGQDMIDAQDARLPFRIKANNSKQLQVELFPIIDSLAGVYYGINKPAYYIPLPITADGNGSVRITIDSNNTSIRNSQTFKIAVVLDENGNIIDDGKDDNTVINKYSSENETNKVVTIRNNQRIEGIILRILPKFEVDYGDSIIINIENGKIDDDIILQNDIKGEAFDGKEIVSFRKGDIIEKYQYKLRGHTYGYYADYYEKCMKDSYFEWNTGAFQTIIGNDIIYTQDARLPFRIKANNSKQLQVELFPIIDLLVNGTYHGTNRPTYSIPLPITADGIGDVKITIDSNNTSISGGIPITIAKSTASENSTETSTEETTDLQYNYDMKHNVDGDDIFSISDVEILFETLLSKSSHKEINILEHDVDGDGIFSANDISILLHRVLDKNYLYPAIKTIKS